MAEVQALHKAPCPECGGDLEWNASKRALACPYCGTMVPGTPDATAAPAETGMPEHPLEAALRAAGGKRGLGEEKKAVKCESCHAISIFDPGHAARRCDFCGSPSIVPHDTLGEDAITPESILPAVIPAPQVRDMLRAWYRSRWWAPNKLKRAALTDTLHGVYLPYWTFDCQVEADWTAESGYHYYVTESYRGADGKTQTRQVRKTRWSPSAGHLSHFFDDTLVPATTGVHLPLLRQVEPFPTTTDLKPYDPAFVRGWTVERYQIDLAAAAQQNMAALQEATRRLCAAEVPGDTHRNLEVAADFRDRTFKHILVPAWLVSYTYRGKSYQVLINGYTGKTAGEHPLSWIKITLAVLAFLLAVLIFFNLAGK